MKLRHAVLLAAPLFALAAFAQTQDLPSAPQPQILGHATSDSSPVGHWVQRGNPNAALQLWWDFRPDGTLTVIAGATARTTWRLAGHVLTVGPTASPQGSNVFDIRFAPPVHPITLYSTSHAANPPTLEFSRVANTVTSATQPIVGIWRLSSAPHATDPKQEAIRNRLANTITAYNADGTYEARVPIDATEGTWDAASHTYTLKGYGPLPYSRSGLELTLSSPIGDKATHAYVRDRFFPAAAH